MEKNGVKVPFARRSGAFVLGEVMAQNVAAAVENDDAVHATTGARRQSPVIPGESFTDEGRIAEILPAPERPSDEAIARRMLTHMSYAVCCQDCVMSANLSCAAFNTCRH